VADVPDTLMWEAAAAPGRLDQLLAWVDGTAAAALLRAEGCRRVSSYRAGDDRAVVVAEFTGTPPRVVDPPAELLRRPVHQWRFRHRWTSPGG
jgi:hypothetical protein